MTYSRDLLTALHCSERAAELALTHFLSDIPQSIKSDGTQVTAADLAVERLLQDLLNAEAPGDALLGEEFGRVGESNRLWILDPIDGTSFFANRDKNWRIHIALEVDGETEVSVVTAPALGRQWWATRCDGAFTSSWPRADHEARLAVSRTPTIADAVIVVRDDGSRRRLSPHTTIVQSSSLPLIELVSGEMDAFIVKGFYAWDHVPWILLIEEAGGKFTDWSGGRSGYAGGGIYSNSALHSELLAIVGVQEF